MERSGFFAQVLDDDVADDRADDGDAEVLVGVDVAQAVEERFGGGVVGGGVLAHEQVGVKEKDDETDLDDCPRDEVAPLQGFWILIHRLMVQKLCEAEVKSEIGLRGYRAGDADAMFALDESCFAEPFRFTRAAMRRFAESKKARVVVAEWGEELVGFCIVHVERGGVGYVVTLDVAAEHRGKGLARRLMERVEAEAGCLSMMLHVFVGNDAAIGFYERMGYGLVGEAKGFYGAGVDALVYRKEL